MVHSKWSTLNDPPTLTRTTAIEMISQMTFDTNCSIKSTYANRLSLGEIQNLQDSLITDRNGRLSRKV